MTQLSLTLILERSQRKGKIIRDFAGHGDDDVRASTSDYSEVCSPPAHLSSPGGINKARKVTAKDRARARLSIGGVARVHLPTPPHHQPLHLVSKLGTRGRKRR